VTTSDRTWRATPAQRGASASAGGPGDALNAVRLRPVTPFDARKLDRLMDDAGVDLVLASSPHNVQYLLGGYRFFLFAHGTAMGVSRYLPLVGYVKGRPDAAFYIGNPLEAGQQELEPLWVAQVQNGAWTTAESAELAAKMIRALNVDRGRIAVERSFLPEDAHAALVGELPAAQIGDAFEILEELRAIKRPGEIDSLRTAAEGIVGSMLAVFAQARPGITKLELVGRLRVEEARRGLDFEYCLPSTGRSFNRAPSGEVRWEEGELCCLDSGGSLHGYAGDLARMASMGPLPPAAAELLDEVDAVQQAARTSVVAGRRGGDVLEAAFARMRECPHADALDFVAHGVGLITHEVPRLTSTGVVRYPGRHEDRPLEAGMVLSIETDLRSPAHGFVKLEDTLVVTETGCEPLGDGGRAWNLAGSAEGLHP
jgi:Xaa-Pro aminopeptidase